MEVRNRKQTKSSINKTEEANVANNVSRADEQRNDKHAKWFMLLVIVFSFMAIIYHSNLVTLNLKKLNSAAIK
jgi:type IV secretory pathway component VirB8